MALRILVLGSGGREHALAWKLAQSTLVQQIFVCPGNGGTSQIPKTRNISVGNNSFEELVGFAVQEKVKLQGAFTIFYSRSHPDFSRSARSRAAPRRWSRDVLPERYTTQTYINEANLILFDVCSRHSSFRTHCASRQNGRIQGLLQGFHGTPLNSDCQIPRLYILAVQRCRRVRQDLRFSDRSQGQRPRCGQGRPHSSYRRRGDCWSQGDHGR